VVRPFGELRLVLDGNLSGVAFDITWTSRLEPILASGHFEVHRSGRAAGPAD
jgi:hypothetical protein